MTKVTVYSPCYNYGNYLDRAIESVISQTMNDWELIVIDDGSTDHTGDVLEKYASHSKIKIVCQENKGLNASNNIALRLAGGKYVMRLDADDYLDENALLVLSNILDTRNDVGLVYPDYFLIDDNANILELIRRKKIGDEVELLDLPAHGACTMFRREVLIQLDGYSEEYNCQDGYDLWIRFIQNFRPYNVNVPLFYYRQHHGSITTNAKRLLETRYEIQKNFSERELTGHTPQVLGIIPVARNSPYPKNEPNAVLAGQALISYTLNEALRSDLLDRIVMSTSHPDAIAQAEKHENIEVIERPPEIEIVNICDSIGHVLDTMEHEQNYIPDAICVLNINSPLRRAQHIDRAVNVMQIFDVDSVISVSEELSPCYQHDRNGLRPIDFATGVRLEKEAIYKDNSAVHLARTNVVRGGSLIGETVGHLTMLPEESVKINSEFEFWLAENLLEDFLGR